MNVVLIVLPTITSRRLQEDLLRHSTTNELTNRPTHYLQSRRNKMKETTAPMGAEDRGEARHGSTTRRRVGGTPTRAYGGDSPNNKCDMGTPYSASIRGRKDSTPIRGARILSDVAYKKVNRTKRLN